MEMVLENDWHGDLGSLLFSYLWNLWTSARGSYCGSLQRRRLSVRQANVNNSIKMKIQEYRRKFETFRAEMREITQGLLCGKSDAGRLEF